MAAGSGLDDTVPAQAATEPISDSPPAGAPPLERETAKPAPPPDERYRLGAELGRGGMGRVVEAYDVHLGRAVALKEVLPQSAASIARRFQREVKITARLEHASIVPLYDSGVMADGRPFYVMRRVSGKPLDELIARSRGLDERLALLPNVLAAIDAIAHAHRRGVIHRDIKPQNILVGELGETVVIDWGLAKVIGEDDPVPDSLEPHVPPSAADSLQTQVGSVFGTPGFMAPEQARGDELDPRTDVFALGATLYQLIAGKPPVAGKSATEMIASTLVNKIVPVTRLAPNAPAELATIIAKALAYDAAQRYADAGALGEDVRAFTTGQLVAAHRYTRRQRIARFAKRHRAALSVAALAATAVAVLSWFSVHRIVKERDVATSARNEAEAQRVLAERRTEEARQRADQLLLAHARGLLDTSPTQAIAVLAHLESTTPQTIDAARAIAKAAVARGVAWGVRSLPGMTTSFEMTRDGKRLLQVNRFGKLQVIDLEQRKQIAATDIGTGSRATWVAGDKILVTRDKQPPALFDPATRALDAFGTAPVNDWDKTPDGALVAYQDDKGNVGLLDIAARTQTPLWTKGTAERSLAIAQDGTWLAFGDKLDAKHGRLVVIDHMGQLLFERPGSAVVLGASHGGKLAVSLFDEIFEVKPADPAHAVTKVPVTPSEAQLVHQLVYRDEVLYLLGGRSVTGFANGRVFRSDVVADTVYFAQPSIDRMMVVAANDSNVHLLREGAQLVLPITEAPEGMYRVAAAHDSGRVAATAKDVILIWDTAALFPKLVETPPGLFITNRKVVVPEGSLSTWYVWDLDAGKQTPIQSTVEGIPIDYAAEPAEGRLLVTVQGPQGTSAVVIHADGKAELAVPELGKGDARIVPGNAIVYSLGKNRIFGKLGNEPARELVTVDGELLSLAPAKKLGYAALSSTGELVKGTFSGGDFQRTTLTDLDKHAFVVCDAAGTVLVGSGNRLLRWHGDIREVARFAVPIDYVAPTELGLYVSLTNHDLYFLPQSGNQTPQRVPVTQLSAISPDGRVVIGMTPSQQIEVVDMPSLAAWSLPKLYTGFPRVVVSPDGAVLAQSLGASVALWRVSEPGSDFKAWLAEQTNATDDDGHVHWPWQP